MTAPAGEIRKSPVIAMVLTAVAYAYYNIGDAAVKLLAQKFHISQIIFVNALIIIVLMSAYGAWKEGKAAFVMRNPRWVLLRSVIATAVTACNTMALSHVRLTTFYTIVFTSPFWVAILSAFFLKEKLDKSRIAVIMFGFCVILYIMRPDGALFNIWAGLVLISAFLYSCSVILLRYLGGRESRSMVITMGSVVGAASSLPWLFSHYIPMNMQDIGVFAIMGVTGGIGVFCIAYAFQTAPSAAVIAPFHYTQMVWGALLGYFLFNEMPDRPTMIGAGLLILGGCALIFLESRSSVRRQVPYRAAGWFSRLRAYNPNPKQP